MGATALLSIPALDRVCKEIYSKYSENSVKFWTGFDKKIDELRNDTSKRDVDLRVYRGRPGAVDEWCEMMGLVPEVKLKEELDRYLHSLSRSWNLHGELVIEKIKNLKPKWLNDELYHLVDKQAKENSEQDSKRTG